MHAVSSWLCWHQHTPAALSTSLAIGTVELTGLEMISMIACNSSITSACTNVCEMQFMPAHEMRYCSAMPSSQVCAGCQGCLETLAAARKLYGYFAAAVWLVQFLTERSGQMQQPYQVLNKANSHIMCQRAIGISLYKYLRHTFLCRSCNC